MATLHTYELRLRGYLSPEPSLSALRSDLVSVAAEFRPAAFRSGTEREAEVVVTDGDLVEVEFEDGLRIWLTGEEYREKLEKEGKRSLDATGALDVPDTLPFGGSDATSRGIVGWVLKALKVIKVDPAAKSAEAIARAFEDKTQAAKRRGPGFYRCSMATGGFALFDPPAKIDADRLLVFIHGTASSTWGSFGELWSPARSGTLTELRRIYGENVFALDHRSLTESPITNALQLARELGKRVKSGARIDIVSHSRGGLVGELLCRMNIVGAGAHNTIINGGGPVLTIGAFNASTEPTVSISGVTITGGVTHSSFAEAFVGPEPEADSEIEMNPQKTLERVNRFGRM